MNLKRLTSDNCWIQKIVLKVRGLSKRFGALAVAQAIDLDLTKGARIGLIGPNGAGKTTLVNLLTGMIWADEGSIELNGAEIRHMKPETRVKRGLARTHQINTLLTENTARENVAVAIAERDNLAWQGLRFGRQWRACMDESDSRLNEIGIGEIAERRVVHLAYGQQRLLEIAIALALKPRVLLLAEGVNILYNSFQNVRANFKTPHFDQSLRWSEISILDVPSVHISRMPCG